METKFLVKLQIKMYNMLSPLLLPGGVKWRANTQHRATNLLLKEHIYLVSRLSWQWIKEQGIICICVKLLVWLGSG